MSEYTVRGRIQSRDGWEQFETAVGAPNEDVAVERCYANLGSRHGLKRQQIEVAEVAAE